MRIRKRVYNSISRTIRMRVNTRGDIHHVIIRIRSRCRIRIRSRSIGRTANRTRIIMATTTTTTQVSLVLFVLVSEFPSLLLLCVILQYSCMRKRNSIRDMFRWTRTCASIRIGNAMCIRIRNSIMLSVRTRMARVYIGWVILSIRFSIRVRMISSRPPCCQSYCWYVRILNC